MYRLRLAWLTALIAAAAAAVPFVPLVLLAAGRDGRALQRQGSGWHLPPDAPDTKNPLTVTDKVLAEGKKIFAEKCRKCHGPQGLGDGPDADPEYIESMNLTNPKRAERNPDGVVFHKVSNGRSRPKMPAFKEELTPEQIWTVVSYVQTLRKK